MDYLYEVIEAIKPVLKKYGFKKNRLNWISEKEECYKIFNIQKSIYGKNIYLNIGIQIKCLIKNESKLIYKCHIQKRIDDLIGKEYLDFENNNEINRIDKFISLLENDPYNFFSMKGNKNDIIKFANSNNKMMIKGKAEIYLSQNG